MLGDETLDLGHPPFGVLACHHLDPGAGTRLSLDDLSRLALSLRFLFRLNLCHSRMPPLPYCLLRILSSSRKESILVCSPLISSAGMSSPKNLPMCKYRTLPSGKIANSWKNLWLSGSSLHDRHGKLFSSSPTSDSP